MADSCLLTGEKSSRFRNFGEKFYAHNLKDLKRQRIFIARIFFIALALCTAIVNSITGVGIPTNNIDCMWDGLFALTSPLNEFFIANSLLRHLLLIFSSFLIDVQYLFFCFHYAFFGNSARPLIFLTIFYLFRMFIQSIFMMRYPEGMAWDYPGIPSFSISYAYTTDFFFSGHVGILVFTSLENHCNKNYKMMVLSIFSVIVEFNVMVVLRGHYSIDLISGMIFGHYFWGIANKLANKSEEVYRRIANKEKKQPGNLDNVDSVD